MPTTADRPPLMTAIAVLRRLAAYQPVFGEDVALVVAELDKRGLEIKGLKENQRRLAAEYHTVAAQLDALREALLAPDQPTAIKNLIALRAEEASK